jgi:thiamine-monophosphate kinase
VNELERIARLARAFATTRDGVHVGIGDDAAVLKAPDGAILAWTIDEQIEGTHFRRDMLSWADVGWRAMVAAASDLFAMGATPWCALAAVGLTDDVDDAAFDAITAGQRAAADAVGAAIVGGNLGRAPGVSIATTLLGTCARGVERRGARVGDGLWIAGDVGLAAAGFRALERHNRAAALEPAIDRWRRPAVLAAEGASLAKGAHAAVDVSDGLARDVGQLGRASRVRIVFDAAALKAHGGDRLALASEALGDDPLSLALHGGEDYALVAASNRPIDGFVRIGDIEVGEGVFLRRGGEEERVEERGFDHFPERRV